MEIVSSRLTDWSESLSVSGQGGRANRPNEAVPHGRWKSELVHVMSGGCPLLQSSQPSESKFINNDPASPNSLVIGGAQWFA